MKIVSIVPAVAMVAKPGTMNAAHWWNAHVINNGSVHCEAHWSNDNTVTIRAR